MKTVVLAMLCMALVGGGVVLGLLVAFSALQPSASSVFPEYLVISEAGYGIGSNGWVAVRITNTGIGSVTLMKVYVNYAKQTSVTPPFPITVGPDDTVILNVTMNIVLGEDYHTVLFTSQGNRFDTLISVPSGQQPSIILYRANVNFYNISGVKKIDLDIGNSGTSDTRIIQAYVGTSPTALYNQTINPVNLPAGTIQRITIVYNWTAGATHYFRVVCSAGQTLSWPEQAPVNP